VFYSYFNTTFNRSAEAIATAKRGGWTPEAIARLAMDFLFLYSFPAALSVLIKRALKGGGDDKDRSLGGDFLKEHLSNLMATIVGIREFSGALSDSFGYKGPAGTMGFQAISDLIVQAKQGELDQGLAKAATKAVGIWAHLPVSQVTRTIEGFMYDQKHHTADPRPLLFGPPPKGR
jgi:hypothetical protein